MKKYRKFDYKKLTLAEKLEFYEYMKDFYIKDSAYWLGVGILPNGLCAAMCVTITNYFNLNVSYNVMETLTDLYSLRPEMCYGHYWFRPQDTESRVKLLDEVIESIKVRMSKRDNI